VERFGRRFIITEHTHLQGTKEREILPWLRISAELDPQKVETYVVAAYWLRELGKVKEAERFLRQGMLHNPDSYEILFELGRLYYEADHDPARARKIWDLALRKWAEQEAANQKPDLLMLDQIALNLSRLEEREGNLARPSSLELSKKASPSGGIQKQIDGPSRSWPGRRLPLLRNHAKQCLGIQPSQCGNPTRPAPPSRAAVCATDQRKLWAGNTVPEDRRCFKSAGSAALPALLQAGQVTLRQMRAAAERRAIELARFCAVRLMSPARRRAPDRRPGWRP
jgi:tetratricopeptide (TPR) repeat protein